MKRVLPPPPSSPKGKEEEEDSDDDEAVLIPTTTAVVHKKPKRVDAGRDARRSFYGHLFPLVVDVIVALATCGGQFKLEQREIALRFLIDGSDVQKRDIVFHNAQELVDRLVRTTPATIQFGGIFLGSLNDPGRKQERYLCTKDGCSAYGQFCIDVDMEDYGALRDGICKCPPYTVCNRCWHALLEPGRELLDYVLRDVMGFKAILYVFSGRRGYHVWVLDKRVTMWTAYQRASVTHRLQNLVWTDEYIAQVAYRKLWPSFELNLLRNNPCQTYAEDWALLEPYKRPQEMEKIKRDAVLTALNFKLDRPVSEDVTHLVKLMLVLHQETGYFTIPIPPPGGDNPFNPDSDSLRSTHISTHMMNLFSKHVRKAVDIAYGV